MVKKFLPYFQHIAPQHGLSRLAGWLAEQRSPSLKNWLIKLFMAAYDVDLQEAILEKPEDYISFNDFFTRKLKPSVRPLATEPSAIVSPVDGTIAQIGTIKQQTLIQAKSSYFILDALFGNDKSSQVFHDGNFATLYLAPHNYHRIHMPLTGKLLKTIYVPGKLFSVNKMTTEIIPNLFARNERLICLFETEAGQMAVVLVGAMIVGSMQTVWMSQPIRSRDMVVEDYTGITLKQGDELGLFKLGSTVILLFGQNKVEWSDKALSNSLIQYGQLIGNIIK